MPTDEEIENSLRPEGDRLALPGVDPTAPALDPAAPAGTSPVAPNPDAAFDPSFDPRNLGPAQPGALDPLIAQQPPPLPGIPTRDPALDLVPGVPREAPGNIGAPAPLPGAPAGPGGAGGAPGGNPEAGVAESLAEEKAQRDAALEAETARAEGGEGKNAEDLDIATKRREQADEGIKRAQEIQQRYDVADKAAQDHYAQTQAALKGFKFKDFWADKSSAQHVLSALGVALGAFGSGLTKTPNYALQILDKAMDDDHKRQVAQLNQLSDEEVTAHTGIVDAREGRKMAMADLTATDAHKDRLIAAQLEEAAARSTDLNYKNVVAANVAKLREAAAAKDTEAQKMLRALSLETQMKQAQIKEAEARANMYNAHAGGTGGFVPKHKAGAGGGGSSKVQDAAVALAKEIEARKAAKNPMSYGEMSDYAAAHGIPLRGKAGQTTLETVIVDSGKLSTQGQHEDAAWNKDLGAVDNFVRTKFKDDAQLAADLKEKQEVSKAMALAKPGKDGNVNGVSFQQAIDATVKAATGLGARPQSIQVFQGSLGGLWDKVMRNIQHGETGQYTPHDVETLNNALAKQRKYIDGNLSEKEKGFREFFSNHPMTKDKADVWEAEMKQRFQGGNGDLLRKARAAVNDPGRAPAVRAAAQKIIDQAGANGG